jgi:hypothetical protein
MPLAVSRPSLACTTSSAIKRPSMVQRRSVLIPDVTMLQLEMTRWKSIARRSIQLQVSIFKLIIVLCRANRCAAVTEHSSLNPENLSPSLGYRIANPGYLEWESNLSNFEAPGAGLAKPSHSESEACYNDSTFEFSQRRCLLVCHWFALSIDPPMAFVFIMGLHARFWFKVV